MPFIEAMRMLMEEALSCRLNGVRDKIIPHPLLDPLVDLALGPKQMRVDDQVIEDPFAVDACFHQDTQRYGPALEEAPVGEDREFLVNPDGASNFDLLSAGVVDFAPWMQHGEVGLAPGETGKNVRRQFVEAVSLCGKKGGMATFRQEAVQVSTDLPLFLFQLTATDEDTITHGLLLLGQKYRTQEQETPNPRRSVRVPMRCRALDTPWPAGDT